MPENEAPTSRLDISRPEQATTPTPAALAEQVRTAADSSLMEDAALALLKDPDLHPDVLEQLAKNSHATRNRKVRIGVVSHPHTPRHVSVPLARQLYTFDLMKVALATTVPADVKVAVEDVLISRLSTITAGERLTLARRASGRIAAALLLGVDAGKGSEAVENAPAQFRNNDGTAIEDRVLRTALDNPRLTEALVIGAALHTRASAAMVQTVARHSKWSKQREIQKALLRTEYLPLGCALGFAREIPPTVLSEVLATSKLPERIKAQLWEQR